MMKSGQRTAPQLQFSYCSNGRDDNPSISRNQLTIMNRMAISEQVQKDMTDAMRARDERRLSALRMVKAALKNREIEKRAPLEDKDSIQVLNTLLKQRKDSVEQFTRGNRPELAKK